MESRWNRLRHVRGERGGSARSVRVRPLPLVAERRDRPLLAVGDEDRVVAKAFAAVRLVSDAALENAGASMLLTRRRQRDELTDVARSAAVAFDAAQLGEQASDGIVAAEAR